MDSINNKYSTIFSSILLVILVSIIAFTNAFEYEQAKLLLTVATVFDLLMVISSVIRWSKHGEVTTFKSDDNF